MHLVRKNVIFDLDGTLVDTAVDLTSAINFSLSKVELPILSEKIIRSEIGNGVENLVKKCAQISAQKETIPNFSVIYELFLDRYDSHLTDESSLYSGVRDTLGNLKTKDFKLSICTNKSERQARKLLKHLEIDKYFELIIGGDSTQFHKPDERLLSVMLQKLSETSRNTIFIGDSKADIQFAENSKIPIIIHSNGYTNFSLDSILDHQKFTEFSQLQLIMETK